MYNITLELEEAKYGIQEVANSLHMSYASTYSLTQPEHSFLKNGKFFVVCMWLSSPEIILC